MKYAVDLPNFGVLGDARILADLAADAEAAGWDAIFVWDHIQRKPEFGAVVDPWIALTAMTMRTSTIRLGAMITPLARRRPWKVARETASLDQLSEGRLIFGAGLGSAGGKDLEWDTFGEEMDLKTRGAMLDEALDILTGLWSGELFSYEGAQYQVKETRFLPTPAQTPRIPIWIAGLWPNKVPFRRALRWDGIMPLLSEDNTLGDLKAMMAYLREQGLNDRPFDVVLSGITGKDAQHDRALMTSYEAEGATWWVEDLLPTYFSEDWRSTWTPETIRARIVLGPPR